MRRKRNTRPYIVRLLRHRSEEGKSRYSLQAYLFRGNEVQDVFECGKQTGRAVWETMQNELRIRSHALSILRPELNGSESAAELGEHWLSASQLQRLGMKRVFYY